MRIFPLANWPTTRYLSVIMTWRRRFCFTGIATVVFVIAGGLSTVAEQIIVVTQAVENPFPRRMMPYGVGPRANGEAVTPAPGQLSTPSFLPDAILAWNKTTNEVTVEAGAMLARFTFIFTNVSSVPITINTSSASCGCTTANLPDLPKAVQPREHVEFQVQMNVGGKRGMVEKTVTISTDKGDQVLHVVTIIKPDNAPMSGEDRSQNLQIAQADRQAVFREDCARCHAEPARSKMGKDLFAATCAVCHESEHRASMVPNLHALPHETDAAFWLAWITYGKPGSLMPAFSQNQGGILSSEQMTSLVDYLVEAVPNKPAASFTKATGAAADGKNSLH